MTNDRLPLGTYLLSLAQALNLTAAVISVTISAIVGGSLSSNPALATLPYGVQFAAVMLFTYPASWFMGKFGRRKVFSAGAVLLFVSGLIGYMAIDNNSFYFLVISHFFLGGYIACANFYRFATVDSLSDSLKARGISFVVAGGVAAAVLGPAIASNLKSIGGFADFSLCYAALSGLGLATGLILVFWKAANAPPFASPEKIKRNPTAKINHTIIIATITSAWGYLAMNLLMVQASLVMKDICSFNQSSNAIQAHVLAMFIPSFFTGALIAKFGLNKVIYLGHALIVSAGIFGLLSLDYENIFWGLVLLGVGWNFTYVGGGALLARSIDSHNRHRWQGISDTAVSCCATIGAFLPAPMLNWFGWGETNKIIIIVTVMCAISSFFLLFSDRRNNLRSAL